MRKPIEILETPRDAMQGMSHYISTSDKLELLHALLAANFDILDIGSFVNPRIIPQFSDLDIVLSKLRNKNSTTRLFVLVANEKGAQKASVFPQIDFMGFPFSTSETFLQENIHAGLSEGWERIHRINEICVSSNKQLMVYLAMAFGNPYGDENTIEIIQAFTEKLVHAEIHHISLSDIIGVAKPEFIAKVYKNLSSEFPDISFGMHLHIHPQKTNWRQKLEAAYEHGCIRFDGVINGMGGCPLSGYEKLGNLPTGHILRFANDNQLNHQIKPEEFKHAKSTALRLIK